MVSLWIPTRPTPASRPKVTRWKTYYGKTYTAFRDAASAILEKHPGLEKPVEGAVAIVSEFIQKPPKTITRKYPRGDNDNFEKAAWDAVTKAGRFWKDDDQVVLNVSHKRYAEEGEEEGVALHIYGLA